MQTSTECKPYQRRWREWAVDRNLENGWLERLNSLNTLNLVSICEGHLDARPISIRRGPSIILSFQKEYLRPLTEQWFSIRKALSDAIKKIWQDEDTAIEFEIQHRIDRNRDGLECSNGIICRVVSVCKRDTAGFPEWANYWFQQSVFRIETFDKFMKNFLIINGERK